MKNLAYLILFSAFKSANFDSIDSKFEINGVDLKNMNDIDLVGNIGDNTKYFKDKDRFELKSFYETEGLIEQINTKKCENFIKTVDNYVLRYNHEIKEFSETINVDFEISITGEDLAFLQNYAKSREESAYPRDLSKLDAILSKIAKLKERSFMEKAMRSAKSTILNFDYLAIFNHPKVHYFIPFFLILAVTWMIYYFSFNKSFFMCISIIINSMILWDSLMTYWKRIREAEVEIYLKTLHSGTIPRDCNPENMSWYHSLSNYIFGSNCLQYYKNINRNSVEEVSFFQCIIDTYGLYFIQTPFKIFGASVRVFTDEVTGSWPFPLSLLKTPMTPAFVIILGIFILILFGKGFKFSFLGASFQIGEVRSVPVIERREALTNHTHKMTKDTKKPKLALKSRFPRRLPIEMSKRKNWMKYFKNNEVQASDQNDNSSST